MKLINMKLPKRSKEKMAKEMVTSFSEDYPWGLNIRFEQDQIEKIGVLKDLDAEDTVHIRAKGYVKEVRIESVAGKGGDGDKASKKRHSVEIQITDIGIATDDAESAFNEKED